MALAAIGVRASAWHEDLGLKQWDGDKVAKSGALGSGLASSLFGVFSISGENTYFRSYSCLRQSASSGSSRSGVF